jgi:phosphoenolpyruvate carboxykinase (ATP)
MVQLALALLISIGSFSVSLAYSSPKTSTINRMMSADSDIFDMGVNFDNADDNWSCNVSKPTENAVNSLVNIGIEQPKIIYQATPDYLTRDTLKKNRAELTSKGVLLIKTGKFTGRSPEDRFIVRDDLTDDRVWWGAINKPFDLDKFEKLRSKVISYLNGKEEVFVRDATVGGQDSTLGGLRLRVINEYPEHNQFASNMFSEPTIEELQNYAPEWTVIHAPDFYADPAVDGTRQGNFAILCFSQKTILIGGTSYTGEIKKGVFSALNFILPVQQNTLPMHCSANVGMKHDDTALFFGLSGTGKTTLSTDPNRALIGDDEHGWTPDDRVFNFEGGCYAKVVDLSEEKEPDIWRAIRPGAILENVVLDNNKEPNYMDTSITENTRVSYPISHIDLVQPGLQGPRPQNIFFLTADAYGVLPPLSRLSPIQAAYHFMSGYTAKVAGTEAGVKEPKATFSACFGAPFMPLHPSEYADMLVKRIEEGNINVWLVNTGWVGGAYGVGSRIKLKYTRALITAALEGTFDTPLYRSAIATDELFHLTRITAAPGVPDAVLNPRDAWANKEEYDSAAERLAKLFVSNFKTFEGTSSALEIAKGGPSIVEAERKE